MEYKIIKWFAISLIAITQLSCTSPDNADEKPATDNVVLRCPIANEITNRYSIAGPAIGYTCCTSVDLPSEIKEVFVDKELVEDQRQLKSSGSKPVILSQSASTCVRTDSLSAIEKVKLKISVCNTFVVHEHTQCSCVKPCTCTGGQVRFVCNNCPGIPSDQLPEVKPQDSLRSQNEFLGTTTIECSSPPPQI